VEGHELNVLNGAVELVEHSQPVFLVEAEDRHREQATCLVFEFFRQRSYRGYFLKDGGALPVHQFSVEELQDASVLLPDGGRMAGSSYINNFLPPAHGRGVDSDRLGGGPQDIHGVSNS
jgi:hypothetical protein